MTTVLITGAGGFLGSHILQQVLRRTSWDVVAVDSFRHNGGTDRILQAMTENDFPHQIGQSRQQIINDTRHRVCLCTHDLAAPFSVQQLDQLGLVDYIVHAAARCSVDDSIRYPYDHVMNNVQSTLTMLNLAEVFKVDRYLHISTDEVFGPFQGLHTEADKHSPSSPYAASKAACEDLTQAWARTYGVPASIVNSANLFGERQSQLAFIPQTIRRIDQGLPVTIHTRDGEPAWRWYTYAPNVGAWVVDTLAYKQLHPRHLLRGQLGLNVQNLAHRIADIMGKPVEFKLVEGDSERPGFDHGYGQLPQDPSWKPEFSAVEGLENTVNWFLANPSWLA